MSVGPECVALLNRRLEDALAEVNRLRGVLEDVARQLKLRQPDHACGECTPKPRRGAIKPGHRCPRHRALAALS